jgi:hypothetical protein
MIAATRNARGSRGLEFTTLASLDEKEVEL